MTRLPGDNAYAALPDLNEADRTILVADFRNIFAQLRSIPSPYGAKICGFDDGPEQDFT